MKKCKDLISEKQIKNLLKEQKVILEQKLLEEIREMAGKELHDKELREICSTRSGQRTSPFCCLPHAQQLRVLMLILS